MISRSEYRHACFRAKNGVATPANEEVLQHIAPKLLSYQTWENFGKVWDILLNKRNEPVIIKPETDYDYIHSVCLEASLLKKKGEEFDFNDRQNNIIKIVESLMLEGKMTWENYNRAWGIFIDMELKQVKSKLYNIESLQKEVTEQMIKDSIKEIDPKFSIPSMEFTDEVTLDEPKPMTEEEIKKFQEFLKNRNQE